MRAEQPAKPTAVKRVDDHEVRCRGMLLGCLQRDAPGVAVDLEKRVGKRTRIAGDIRTAAVGSEFPAARYRELDEHGCNWREDQNEYRKYGIAMVIVAPAEEHPEVGERRYCPGDRSGDGRCEDIAILDVRKLVREDAAQFLWRQQLKDSGRRRDRGMLGVASRCKSIGLCLVDEIDA